MLYPLPPTIAFEHAALVEPVSVAVHAVELLKIRPGERAVVVGSGMVGLLVIQALRVAGASEVIAIDIDAGRLQLASQLGATHTINSATADAASTVLELTGGNGADVSAEVVGNGPAVNSAIRAVRRGGRVVLIGNTSPEVPLPLQFVVTRELTLYGKLRIGR